ncbi:hypothetical protein CesoFtcFv8_023634 [Champsocephalus esox]|nr:hypothetical protein CesoFtcFv8_023634 [Champsocephalus esox]
MYLATSKVFVTGLKSNLGSTSVGIPPQATIKNETVEYNTKEGLQRPGDTNPRSLTGQVPPPITPSGGQYQPPPPQAKIKRRSPKNPSLKGLTRPTLAHTPPRPGEPKKAISLPPTCPIPSCATT